MTKGQDKINLAIYKKYVATGKEKNKIIDSCSADYASKNRQVLLSAYNAYASLDNFRKEAQRCRMYTFGNQWGDYIRHPVTGKKITEENYIKSQGKVPLKNNLIRGLVRSVLGQFATTQTESICVARDRDEQKLGEMMSAAIQTNYQRNKLWELDRRALEVFLITGTTFFKTTYGWRDSMDLMDVWTDLINYNRIFFDPNMEDVRHWDCSLIGEIHDIALNDLISNFSDGSRYKAKYLRELYKTTDTELLTQNLNTLTDERLKNMDFFIPSDMSRCRVIEVWQKETKERLRVHDTLTGEWYKIEINDESRIIEENNRRLTEQLSFGIQENNLKLIKYEWFIDRYWYYRFLSPFGDVLKEGETPYWHKSHPYTFKIYPFFDSEVHSFVGDAIDQNRYINRLITMQDFIMGAAAKGVLMFPENCKPDSMSMEEIAEEWVSYNGIIYYKPLPGVPPPQQIIANTTQTGAFEMLRLQMELYKDVTGVYGALQGQQPQSGTPAALYNQQTQNSATNLVDVLESFRQLREDRDTKIMKLQQQYYTDIRYLNIVGSTYSHEAKIFNPEKVRNIDFDLSICESVATPAYRITQNELLLRLLEMGQINVEMLLENGSFPFADKLLQSIRDFKTQVQQQQNELKRTVADEQKDQNLPPQTLQQLNNITHFNPAENQ